MSFLQSLMEHNQAKSQFLLQHKEAWDRLNSEVVNLWTHEMEARWHADEAEWMALE
jgi:hypothetical protein